MKAMDRLASASWHARNCMRTCTCTCNGCMSDWQLLLQPFQGKWAAYAVVHFYYQFPVHTKKTPFCSQMLKHTYPISGSGSLYPQQMRLPSCSVAVSLDWSPSTGLSSWASSSWYQCTRGHISVWTLVEWCEGQGVWYLMIIIHKFCQEPILMMHLNQTLQTLEKVTSCILT